MRGWEICFTCCFCSQAGWDFPSALWKLFWLLAKCSLPLPECTPSPSTVPSAVPAGRGGRSSTPFPADPVCSGLLPQAHGGAQGPEARERAAGCTHECKDSWFWYVNVPSSIPEALECGQGAAEPAAPTTWKSHTHKHCPSCSSSTGIAYCRLLLQWHWEWSREVICKSLLCFSAITRRQIYLICVWGRLGAADWGELAVCVYFRACSPSVWPCALGLSSFYSQQ